jgi:hypothetical protein
LKLRIYFAFLSLFLYKEILLAEQPATPNEASSTSFNFSFQQYYLPDDRDLTTPVMSLYTDDLLIEARYNYESRDVGSVWLGKSFSFGDKWEFEFIPMLGGLYGSEHGMAPGLKADIVRGSLNFYSELEYVFNFNTREDNFFYSWSELTYGVLEHLRVGIVGNRTRVYDSAVELDRGPIIKAAFEPFTVYITALDLDDDPIYILGVEASLGS